MFVVEGYAKQVTCKKQIERIVSLVCSSRLKMVEIYSHETSAN
jgi:hypothetical protein